MNWKIIPRFSDYKITNTGQIISCKFNKEVTLKQAVNSNGYFQVNIHMAGVRESVAVHRLLAEAWLNAFSEELQVNHKDGNKLNNELTNLEMVTPSGNIKHAYNSGLLSSMRRNFKLSPNEADQIRDLLSCGLFFQKEIARMYGVTQSCVNISTGKVSHADYLPHP